jgi:hypothetical protein
LSGAQIREPVARLARASIEGTNRTTPRRDVLFGLSNENALRTLKIPRLTR